jgi:hypothetical protein
MLRMLAFIQGTYFAGTGIWPLIHMKSSLAVTGSKTDPGTGSGDPCTFDARPAHPVVSIPICQAPYDRLAVSYGIHAALPTSLSLPN